MSVLPPISAKLRASLPIVGLAFSSVLAAAACSVDERDPDVSLGNGGTTVESLSPQGGSSGDGSSSDDAGSGVFGSDAAPPDAGSTSCEEGTTQRCGTAEGECEFGTQTCEGSRWGECTGGVVPAERDCASPLDHDCDGQADNLIDATCQCVPGEVDDTCGEFRELHGKGACAPGTRTCLAGADGSTSAWSECTGEIGPAAATDRCNTPNDDNCDGTVNGDCPCAAGTSQACGPELEVGVCRRGTASCVEGTLGQCDAVFAGARNCGSNQDNDCNGTIDIDEVALCECVIGETRACNEHAGDGRGRCRAGSQTCLGRLDDTRSSFGACSGDVGPLPNDSCAVANDDSNCDGQVNGGCSCVVGVAASCPNPDPQNCSAACVRAGSDFVTRCEITALDRDGDGVSACAQASSGPLDCNDNNRNVRPGAVEVCNGIDDDCDGLVDLADGLSVGGTTRALTGRRNADVAFNAADNDFRFVSEGGTDGAVSFGVINANNLFPSANVDPHSATVPNALPRIVAFRNEFGIVHTLPSRGGPPGFQGYLVRVNAGGTLLGSTLLGAVGGSDPGLGVRSASGVWITAMGRVISSVPTEVLEVARVDAAGVYTAGASPPTENLGQARVATVGDLSAVIWQQGGTFNFDAAPPAAIRLARMNAALALQATVTQLEAVGAHPDIATVGSSYFMAWAVGPGLRFQRTNTDGTVACSGASTFGDGTLDSRDAVAVENTARGIVVLATDFGGGSVGVFVYDEACRELQRALIPPTATSPSPRNPQTPNLATGGGSTLFTWTEGQQNSQFRLTTDQICN